MLRLVFEAHRIRLAHLFDPVMAVHTSLVEPLPHQITAVYESMLRRQPLRFLLADDPGAGKTIMAGLLIKELIARRDLHRCLIVCPGSLAEQWQDELYKRFHLPFDILTNDKLEAARTGNWFMETHLAIARLDKLSRNEDVQQKLLAPDCRWDLVVCDEAHKMSATVFGTETKYTKRYRLGQLLSTVTRHFLLMTATPHNGKEADFQLFMALLDGDRFEGRFRDGVHVTDVSDLMRRMVKESLLKFDGTPLFPERIAYTVPYTLSDPEARRYEIRHVPAVIRNRDRLIGIVEPVLPRYERIMFEKTLLSPQGQSPAAFVCPGHPLLDAVIDLTLERHRDLLKRGAVLVDEKDAGKDPRILFYIEHAVQDASLTRQGERRVVSRQMLYVEIDIKGEARHIHYAPYLDYRPLRDTEPSTEEILKHPACAWIERDLEKKARAHAVSHVVPEHLAEVKAGRIPLIEKTEAAVKERLTKEITYWDHRTEELKLREQAGKPSDRLNSGEARKRADLLQARLHKRLEELSLEKRISPLPPVVLGGVLVLPMGLIDEMMGRQPRAAVHPADTQASAARARAIVMDVERELGFGPVDREFEKLGYDIESRVPGTGKLRFIEVKGRVTGASTLTVTRNEILYSLNKPEDFILAVIEFMDADSHKVHYIRQPFQKEPDFGVTSVNYDFAELLGRAEVPM